MQDGEHDVFSFAATPEQVLGFSEIDRVGRQDDGQLRGFQRHQVAAHIKEIRTYLGRADALLPNAVIVAFLGTDNNVKVRDHGEGVLDIEIKIKDGENKPGFVVDGQQRLTALSGLNKPGFQVFVSGLICKDYNELRQQFVLINNTRPLPKPLIYELLPNVDGLPERFSARQFAARIVDHLNFSPKSSLRGEVKQHTNPKGTLSDLALQKLVMNSSSDGAIHEFVNGEDYHDRSFMLVSEFFKAVKKVFREEWDGKTPTTSRLKHGAGLVAMGFVMELLYASEGATTAEEFEPCLHLLKPYTAWTRGEWRFAENDIRPWNGIQNNPVDIDLLTNYLVRSMKRATRKLPRIVNA